MLFWKIKEALSNATLGLDDQFLPVKAQLFRSLGKADFRLTAAINIGMVKKVDAFFQSGLYDPDCIWWIQGRHPHAAKTDARDRQVTASKNLFHTNSSSFLSPV